MRERKDIERDLAQARANLEAVTTREGATAEEIRTATEAVQRLTAELNAKIVEIAAEKAQAEAQQRNNDRSLNQLNQRFSMVKFIRQSMPGQVKTFRTLLIWNRIRRHPCQFRHLQLHHREPRPSPPLILLLSCPDW